MAFVVTLLLLLTLVGFVGSYLGRGWLAVPFSLLIPGLWATTYHLESLTNAALWFTPWPTATVLGLAAGWIFQSRSVVERDTAR